MPGSLPISDCAMLLLVILMLATTFPAKSLLHQTSTTNQLRVSQACFRLSASQRPGDNCLENASTLMPLTNAIKELTLTEDDTEAKRIFHGRGGLYEGCEHVTLDWFPPVWLLTSHLKKISEFELKTIQRDLEEQFPMGNSVSRMNLVYQHRAKNASETTSTVVSGEVPELHVVTENGMKFLVQLLRGQNQGIFLDMKTGREWVKNHAKGKKVLNLFAYTCGFSVAALAGGATEVINVDMARGPLKIGQRNHELNGLQQGARFLTHDIFKTWGKIRKMGPYDLIVVDPPSFQKGSFVAKKDYQRILRRIPDFLHTDGFAVICLNAPELDSAWLKQEVEHAAPELEFVMRLENPKTFLVKDTERALKVLIYKKVVVVEGGLNTTH
jgi:23S rRNA (cytosine1962-C5)-methyltransferase